jgi:type III pantothenate kinase
MTAPELIAVDIGNSATKVGWRFELGHGGLPVPAETRSFPTGQAPPPGLHEALPLHNCHWHISSVHRDGTRLLITWLNENRSQDEVRLLTYRDLPIILRVDFPERVGLDRLAAAVAANVIRPTDRPAIVVGAGSAITVNSVAADGAFEGGVILPGFRMTAEALYGADLLPLALLSPDDEPPPVVGKNTEAAIRSGLFWGAVGAVREVVSRITENLAQHPPIYVTGGDLRRLAEHLGGGAIYVPNMALSGIAVAACR